MALTASQQSAVTRATERTRDWIERRLGDETKNIARLYRSSRSALVERLRRIYSDFLSTELDPKTKKMVGPSLTQARGGPAYKMLNQAIDEEVGKLTDSVARQAVSSLEKTRRGGKQLLAKTAIAELPDESRYVLNELTTTTTGGGTFWDRLDHMSDKFKGELTGEIRQGLLNRRTFDEVREKVMTKFGVDKLPAPQGPAYGSVRNYTNEARRQWNLLMAEQEGVAVWWAMVDDPDTTPGCLARHGWRVDEDLDGELPPRHINCRCTIAMFEAGDDLSVHQADALEELRARGYSLDDAEEED